MFRLFIAVLSLLLSFFSLQPYDFLSTRNISAIVLLLLTIVLLLSTTNIFLVKVKK